MSDKHLPTPSEIAELLKEALIDALICAREDGREDSPWYGFAVEALAKAGYDEYGEPLGALGATEGSDK
jgi:hypothetical protein